MTVVVGIVSRCDLKTEVCHRNQLNKSKLALYTPLLSRLKQLYMNNKTEHFSYKGGCGVHGRCTQIKTLTLHGLGYR